MDETMNGMATAKTEPPPACSEELVEDQRVSVLTELRHHFAGTDRKHRQVKTYNGMGERITTYAFGDVIVAEAHRIVGPPSCEEEEMFVDRDGLVEHAVGLRIYPGMFDAAKVGLLLEDGDAWYVLGENKFPSGYCTECGAKDPTNGRAGCSICEEAMGRVIERANRKIGSVSP